MTHPYSPSLGFRGCANCGKALSEHADPGPGDAREQAAAPDGLDVERLARAIRVVTLNNDGEDDGPENMAAALETEYRAATPSHPATSETVE